jgi:long-chain acyl-CoA synthetase
VARIDPKGHVYIIGRLKEILVMSTGEKVPPNDLELAITQDPLFDQALVVGEGRAHLAALVVLNPEAWRAAASGLRLDPAEPHSLAQPAVTRLVHERIATALRAFPSYARVPSVSITLEPWTIEDGLVTPSMKLKRPELERRFAATIKSLYADRR